MRAISYLTFVKALKAGSLAAWVVPAEPWVCKGCGQTPDAFIRIAYRGRVCCPSCVPRSKTCKSCGTVAPVESFGIAGHGILARCDNCQRAQQRRRYAARKRNPPKPLPKRVCTTCGRERPAKAFYLGPTYRGGIMSECKECRNARCARDQEHRRLHGPGRRRAAPAPVIPLGKTPEETQA